MVKNGENLRKNVHWKNSGKATQKMNASQKQIW